MSRRLSIKLFAVIVVIAFAAAGAVYFFRDKPQPVQTAKPYFELWERGRFNEMARLVREPPADFAAVHEEVNKELLATGPEIRMGAIRETDGAASAEFTASYDLKGLGDWTFRGRLKLVPGEERWLVDWAPDAIHPALSAGRTLKRSRSWPPRAPILAADSSPIVGGGQGVVVGMHPSRVKDGNEVAMALQANLGSDPSRVLELLERGRARPDAFIAVEEIAEERYAQVRPAIYDIPGLVFQRKDLRLPPSDEFARQLLGRVGEITKERLDELGEPYIAGDRVGRFGLEAALERQLAGRPSGEVAVVDEKGATLSVLRRFRGEPAREVMITLDKKIQSAADAALREVGNPAALVALDSASGEVRAVANRPLDGFNRAVAGRYPPGSTFKVVTTAALLSSGVGVDDKVDCPSQTSAGGRTFRNFEGRALGNIDFRTAFVQSCNTAFANLVRSLDDEKLTAAAESFGFGAQYSLRVSTAGGTFPRPKDTTERVAAAIGQARVESSPLHMASVAAAVASGTWRPPSLIKEPAPSGASPEGRELDSEVAAHLRELMKSVVAEGTGEGAALPGRELAGKTGTAEFGTAKPPRTHAWFIGFSGPLAFAVVVEDGGVGGEVAAPLAAKFLSMLDGA